MADIERIPSYTECVATVLKQAGAPLTVDEIVDNVSDMRQIGVGARSAVLRALTHLYQAVPVSAEQYGWLPRLITGSSVRHPLNDQEIRRGFLMLDELEHAVFFPEFFQNHTPVARTVQINLWDGPTLEGTAYVERHTWSLDLGADFSGWVERLGGTGRDNIIIHAEDAVSGIYSLRVQPYEMRDFEQMKERNLELAMTAETALLEDRRQRSTMPTWELAAMLLARGVYRQPNPPDELHAVLYHFSLLALEEGEGYKFQVNGTRRFDQRTPHRNQGGHDSLDSAMQFLGWADETTRRSPSVADDWLDLFDNPDLDAMDDFDDEDEYCNAFMRYLDRIAMAEAGIEPLSHRDFHLVAAELEYMLALEQEFDDLLPDQFERKRQLAERLLLDPEAISNEDLDIPDNTDFDDPPFWEN